LIIKTQDGEKAILELKATQSPSHEHLQQLYFDMGHFKIDKGFLVNFPREINKFPEDFKAEDFERFFLFPEVGGGSKIDIPAKPAPSPKMEIVFARRKKNKINIATMFNVHTLITDE